MDLQQKLDTLMFEHQFRHEVVSLQYNQNSFGYLKRHRSALFQALPCAIWVIRSQDISIFVIGFFGANCWAPFLLWNSLYCFNLYYLHNALYNYSCLFEVIKITMGYNSSVPSSRFIIVSLHLSLWSRVLEYMTWVLLFQGLSVGLCFHYINISVVADILFILVTVGHCCRHYRNSFSSGLWIVPTYIKFTSMSVSLWSPLVR